MSARTAAAAELQLRESKLRIPVERAGAIPRTVLVERLGASRRASVVLVRAPAGYGKTSAVAEWVRNERRPAAWYSIEAAENDPILFLTYVAAALDAAPCWADRPETPPCACL